MAEVKEKKAAAPKSATTKSPAKPKAEAKVPAVKKVAEKAPAKAAAAKPIVKKEAAPKAEPKKVVAAKPAPVSKPAVKKVETKKTDKPKGKAPYETNGEMTVILTGGLQGCTKRQLATVRALGLRKIGDSKLHKDNGAIRGMVTIVAHLVKVEKN